MGFHKDWLGITQNKGLITVSLTIPLNCSEKKFQSLVVEHAKALGWLCYHTYDSRRSAAGFPDLVMVRGKRTLFVELKTETGTWEPEQPIWYEALKVAEQEVYVLRPRDQATIVAMLK